jgi:polyferredoxin
MAMVAESIQTQSPRKPKKKLVRRAGKNRSQTIRHTVQALFLILNVWIGVGFYRFVRGYETGAAPLPRPAGVEGWLPIASLMNLKDWILTGEIPRLHPAGMFLLLAFVAMSLVFRKAFCGWLCPVGTISEQLWKAGRQAFGRTLTPPRWLDIPLRALKYILLGLFLYAVGSMPVEGIRQFLGSPYGIISDVKMLNFFRFLSVTGAAVLVVIVALSFAVKNFWCRYLCPYGALMGFFSAASPVRIRRSESACIDCGKCANACPSMLPVDQLIQIRSVECTGCLECVAVCPAESALELSVTPRRVVPAWAVAAGIAALFLGTVGWAKYTGHWDTAVPDGVYRELIPRASSLSHP